MWLVLTAAVTVAAWLLMMLAIWAVLYGERGPLGYTGGANHP